jgi:Secretion system C-terminal sorting domain
MPVKSVVIFIGLYNAGLPPSDNSDGGITARIAGGMPFAWSPELNYRKYQFEWRDSANSGITLISASKQYCELKFADTGRYIVGIRAFYANGCIDEKYKEVNVTSRQGFVGLGSQADAFLKQFGLYPNPNTGQFTLSMLFNSVTQARVRIINVLTNATVSDRYLQGSQSYSEAYNISNVPAGTYMVLIETAKGNYIHKLNKL